MSKSRIFCVKVSESPVSFWIWIRNIVLGDTTLFTHCKTARLLTFNTFSTLDSHRIQKVNYQYWILIVFLLRSDEKIANLTKPEIIAKINDWGHSEIYHSGKQPNVMHFKVVGTCFISRLGNPAIPLDPLFQIYVNLESKPGGLLTHEQRCFIRKEISPPPQKKMGFLNSCLNDYCHSKSCLINVLY